MPLTLDLPTLLGNITTIAGTITGIRHAYSYDDVPQRPPGVPNAGNAYHVTMLPGTDGTTVRYDAVGLDLMQYVVEVPLYTIVASEKNIDRASTWIGPYFGRYPEMFRTKMQLNGAITSGLASFEQPAHIVRRIPDWSGYDGFYMIRWVLTCHIKGSAINSP